jgi:hypothetical protein
VKNLRNHCRKGTSNGKFVSVSGGDLPASFSEKNGEEFLQMVENPLAEWVDLLLLGRFLRKLIFWEKSLQKGSL